ncbi:hypothetical protein [Puerhibacterium puerhi]|uniref:hypothetical protein n=1 Tax=Puerhibacterium puerhi TaxID=2692623 RepID=UPI001356A219|nr:hypothetical protein [Puerhibacterium puerhi]
MLATTPGPRRARRAAAVVAVLVGAAALGACSGAADSEPSGAASAVSVPSDALLPESDGGVAPQDDASAGATASPSPSASAGGGAACADLQAAWNETNKALVDLSPQHPRALVHSFRTASKAMASVEPPDAVADAWGDMTDYLGAVDEALQDVEADDAAAVARAVEGAVDADDTATATTASKDITTYISAGCQG